MRNTVTSYNRLALGILAAFVFAWPARGQFVGTAVSGLGAPSSVAVDSNNNLYIADTYNNRIAVYVPSSGSLTTLAGSGAQGTNDDNGADASFDLPWGMVAVGNGLIVSDYGSGLIRFVSFDGDVTTIAGQAFSFLNAPLITNGPADLATFSFPAGLAVDNGGNIYVADSQNNAIREIDTNGNVSTVPVNNGYNFNLPTAVAVDQNGYIWVADSGNNRICLVSNGIVTVKAGSVTGAAGTNDSNKPLNALFRSPSGLCWLPNGSALYISDTGNDTIRSYFFTNGSYQVQTVGGLPGHPGLVNGALSTAELSSPIGVCADPADFGFYVADSANNAVRVLQPTAPLPAVPAPVFGYVTFPASANPANTSIFVASSSAIFNNITNIAIEADQGSETYISFGPTGSVIPRPGPGTDTPPIYPGDGNNPSEIASAIAPGAGTNDITIYAISVQSGRQSSPIVSARFQFITANPSVAGNNAASLLINDPTAGADMYYTIDGSTPTNNGTSQGPISAGTTLSLDITTNVIFQIRAFTTGLAPSQIIHTALSFSNVFGNQMTWGFASGLGSTHYITARNISFSAPVTFIPIPGSPLIYTMQYDLTVTNNGAAAPPMLTSNNFITHLLDPDPTPPIFRLLPPGIFDELDGLTNNGFSNTQTDSLELAWLVTPPVTNLYKSPNLLEYSGVDETLLTLEANGTLMGELRFVIPNNALPGAPFTLRISHSSASTYVDPDCCGQPINVLVQAPTNGPLTGTVPNAVKLVTVLSNNSPESAHLVGDVFPYTWYNIGDFGDGVLLNDDVIETMEFAFDTFGAYPTNNPYYNAMDSGNGTVDTFYGATDAYIDAISNGDGYIGLDDVYVTLRRSLDPALVNYSRYWSGSNWVPAVYNSSVQLSAHNTSPAKLVASAPRYVTVGADQVQTGGGLTAQVPIRVLAADAVYPIKVTMFNVEIDPLDGSPPITAEVTFNAVSNLGAPYAAISEGINYYGAAWLDSTVAGVSGTSVIGTLTVTLPPNVTSNSAYRVHFDQFSASPNGLALFKTTTRDGLITVGNRSGSSWNDGIPDTWRLLHFGTIYNSLSAANEDPDGDGASNWQEFIAGTDPLDASSVFKFTPSAGPSGQYFTLQWPSVVNKSYSIQYSTSLGGAWSAAASNISGNGQPLQWTDTNASAGARFYRALVQ
ncbi:MAG TPA: chitobiase/beta-hexosaminidase C-terminal domain-containing protein [Verrucomicrobiae bacterium]|jgi:sugar lactone lactonase YvrE